MTEPVYIARCAEHGLHGDRTRCFICGAPVEQVPMIPVEDGSGIALIAAERQRQIDAEGWTAEHDDGHEAWPGLAQAAACYANEAWMPLTESHRKPPRGWPWEPQWWKPTGDPIRDLVKAGALIAAEIDRRQREAMRDD